MLLKELSEAYGVSGDERAVRKIILGAIRDHVTDIHIDSIGNLTAIKRGTGEKSVRVMLAAHMDEVGFMVTGIDSNGMLRFTSVGGIDERLLPGMRVRVGHKQLPGVVLWTPIHQNRDTQTRKIKDLRIDIGATSKAGKQGIKPGDRIVFDSRFMEIGESVLRGKALDDRVGCALLIEILQAGPYPVDIVAAFTVQEEIGLRGAHVAAQRLNPDLAIAIEGTTAHDVPNPSADPDDGLSTNPACRMGHGPVLTVMDSSMITAPRMLNHLRQTAEAAGIPYQLKTALGGGTDAGRIHMSNSGIPSAVVAMPCRYIHAPAAYLHRDDYANMLRLLQAALAGISEELLEFV